ncbi:MAG: hypothetical protein KDI46_05525 [Alphaproteobacteria bacterium]|nr:hypothetical protein [Alphaproteobacteria bacterium]
MGNQDASHTTEGWMDLREQQLGACEHPMSPFEVSAICGALNQAQAAVVSGDLKSAPISNLVQETRPTTDLQDMWGAVALNPDAVALNPDNVASLVVDSAPAPGRRG